jgi:hypothetical protein
MLPASLPSDAVHRVICDGCHLPFDPSAEGSFGDSVQRTTPALAALGARLGATRDRMVDRFPRLASPSVPKLPSVPKSRVWAWVSVPLAALAVVAGLSLIQGDGGAPSANGGPTPAGAGAPEARFLEGSGYSLALPAGWQKEDPPEGAAFMAESKDGLADATLWIEEDPELSFKEFEARSLDQLGEIGENARVTDYVEGPSRESTIVELSAESPVAEGAFAELRVTLRGAGDYLFYFSTVMQPGAESGVGAAIETMHASLRPEVSVAGLDDGVADTEDAVE